MDPMTAKIEIYKLAMNEIKLVAITLGDENNMEIETIDYLNKKEDKQLEGL